MRRDTRDAQRRLGERIQTLRRARSQTQEGLASLCGFSQKFLSELERGAKAPSFDTLVLLAHRGFQMSLAAMVFGIDEAVPAEVGRVEELLAGRPDAARKLILQAAALLLDAGRSTS